MSYKLTYPSFEVLVDYVFNQLNSEDEERLQIHLEEDEVSLEIIENLLVYCRKNQIQKNELLQIIEIDKQQIFKSLNISFPDAIDIAEANPSSQRLSHYQIMIGKVDVFIQYLREFTQNNWQSALSLAVIVTVMIVGILFFTNDQSINSDFTAYAPEASKETVSEQLKKETSRAGMGGLSASTVKTLESGYQAYQQRNYAEAAEYFDTFLGENTNEQWVMTDKVKCAAGVAHFQNNHFDKAEEIFRQPNKECSNEKNYYLSILAYRTNRIQEADSLLNEVNDTLNFKKYSTFRKHIKRQLWKD